MTLEDREVLFVPELAKVLRASQRTIYRRLADGTLPIKPLPSIDKKPRFSATEVRRYLEGRNHQGTR